MLEVHIQKQLPHFQISVDFTVRHEIIALFGPSGSGKTTILNAIAGLTKPDSGLIRLHERVLYEAGKIHLPVQQRKVGYLFQDYALFPHKTVWNNIIYGWELNIYKTHTRVKFLVAKNNVLPLFAHLPHNQMSYYQMSLFQRLMNIHDFEHMRNYYEFNNYGTFRLSSSHISMLKPRSLPTPFIKCKKDQS